MVSLFLLAFFCPREFWLCKISLTIWLGTLSHCFQSSSVKTVVVYQHWYNEMLNNLSYLTIHCVPCKPKEEFTEVTQSLNLEATAICGYVLNMHIWFYDLQQ